MSTKKSNRRKYDAVFKAEILKMVDSGRPIPEIAQSLGVGENLIYQWRLRSRKALSSTESGQEELNTQLEIERLRAELRRTEMERDILKKALGIFSRGT